MDWISGFPGRQQSHVKAEKAESQCSKFFKSIYDKRSVCLWFNHKLSEGAQRAFVGPIWPWCHRPAYMLVHIIKCSNSVYKKKKKKIR